MFHCGTDYRDEPTSFFHDPSQAKQFKQLRAKHIWHALCIIPLHKSAEQAWRRKVFQLGPQAPSQPLARNPQAPRLNP